MPPNLSSILAAAKPVKPPQPVKKTEVIRTVVISVRTAELPCSWNGCGFLTPYRVWGLARCRQHVIEDLEEHLDRDANT